jgi:Na+-transporting NADH:ubiquinone oxidoreductase subunit NqrF
MECGQWLHGSMHALTFQFFHKAAAILPTEKCTFARLNLKEGCQFYAVCTVDYKISTKITLNKEFFKNIFMLFVQCTIRLAQKRSLGLIFPLFEFPINF